MLHPHHPVDNDIRGGQEGSLSGGTRNPRNVASLQQLWGMQNHEGGEGGEGDEYDSEEEEDDVKGAARYSYHTLCTINP